MIALIKNVGGVLQYVGEYNGNNHLYGLMMVRVSGMDEVNKITTKRSTGKPVTVIPPASIPNRFRWDLSLVDEALINSFEDLIAKDNYKEIYIIHNSMSLSGDIKYCCNRHKKIIIDNIKIYKDGKN